MTALLLIVAVVACSSYLARLNRAPAHRARQQLTVYTTLPAETASVLSTAYEKERQVRVNFVPLSQDELMDRLKKQTSKDKPEQDDAAMLLADQPTLSRASAQGCLTPYVSEEGDQVPTSLRQDDGYWTGVWYDPVVFCYNQDYLKTLPEVPDDWQHLAQLPDVRIGVTDFMAADAASNLFCSMIAQFGDAAAYAIWRDIHPHVLQYARYLANPVRQAGMGEVDVAIAVESEAMRYMQQGYPLHIVYPADGTAFTLTGTGIVAKAEPRQQALAQEFADWLLGDEAQLALQRQKMYFLPANPGRMSYKLFAGKNIMLFTQRPDFTPQQKQAMLDYWLKEIRFK